MNARELIQTVFIKPFASKTMQYIGVELEFPLLNVSGTTPSAEVTDGLLAFLLQSGFSVDETDIHGKGVFLMNADGDCLSFDNDYSNFEFAMEKSESLTDVATRFYRLFSLVQSYLLPNGCTLTGLGTNPHHGAVVARPVDYPIYRTIRTFLSEQADADCHHYPDFPAWLSSVQTHLDVPLENLPKMLSLFAALDFAHGLLFANSLPFSDATGQENTLCFRDYLWEKSAFGKLSDNTGPVCGTFSSVDDITDAFLKKSIALKKDGEAYSSFPITPIADYIDKVGTEAALEGYLSFKNIEVTRRGTLEVRSDCAQPVSAALAPPAFHLGIALAMDEAQALLDAFLAHLPTELCGAKDRNAQLRHAVCTDRSLPVDEAVLRQFLLSLLELAKEKLIARGLGEDALLSPLFDRAKTLTCPAAVVRNRLQRGESWENIITDFANPDYIL